MNSRRSITFATCSLLVFGFVAHAQLTPDVIGTAGSFSNNLGASAMENRQIADNLYKQSLQDEHNAWSSGIPNVSLLSKALSESKDAKSADDQSKEFARAALDSAQTGTQSGRFSLQDYGALNQNQLQSLATTSSPYMPAVQQTLGSYGLNLDPDKMSLKTPFGDFSVNMSSSTMETVLRGVATALGYSADDVSKGLKEAAATRDSLANAAQSALAAELKNAQAGRSVASTNSSGNGQQSTAGTPGASTAAAHTQAANAASMMDANSSSPDWDRRELRLLENTNRIRRAMGLSAEPIPLGHKDDSIFEMIHSHYQKLQAAGSFIDDSKNIKVSANN